MEAKYLNHFYFPEVKQEIQGKEFELEVARNKLREEGFSYSHGDHGSEIWAKDARGYIFFTYDGKRYMADIGKEIISFYGLTSLYEPRFNRFCKEWQNGEVNVIYDEAKDELVIVNA